MNHLTYLAVLIACVIGTLPLEFAFRARVWRRIRRTALSILPVAAVFVTWDYLAAGAGWWWFDSHYLIGVRVGRLPVEELLFFAVIPVCGILTLEGVRHFKPHWGPDVDRSEGPGVDKSPTSGDIR